VRFLAETTLASGFTDRCDIIQRYEIRRDIATICERYISTHEYTDITILTSYEERRKYRQYPYDTPITRSHRIYTLS
jgi:hypothetical protein